MRLGIGLGVGLALVAMATGRAAADKAATTPTATPTASTSGATGSTSATGSTTPSQSAVLSPLVLTGELPAKPVLSLRLEAERIAYERVSDWPYPDPSPVFGYTNGLWFMGAGRSPRTARSAALHGGSVAATMVGQILMAADSPLAGIGAMLTGATLDAAAADVDRDAEARRSKR